MASKIPILGSDFRKVRPPKRQGKDMFVSRRSRMSICLWLAGLHVLSLSAPVWAAGTGDDLSAESLAQRVVQSATSLTQTAQHLLQGGLQSSQVAFQQGANELRTVGNHISQTAAGTEASRLAGAVKRAALQAPKMQSASQASYEQMRQSWQAPRAASTPVSPWTQRVGEGLARIPQIPAENWSSHRQNVVVQEGVQRSRNLLQTLRPMASTTVKVAGVASTIPHTARALSQLPDVRGQDLARAAEGAARRSVGFTPQNQAAVESMVQRSPWRQRAAAPFQPANFLFAIGTTAGLNLLSSVRSGEGASLDAAFGFMQEKSFWGGLLGSSLGYSIASVVALAAFPAGAGLMATVGPMVVGMMGSIVGWQLGSMLLQGESLKDSLASLSPGRLFGQASGSTFGLLAGSHLGLAFGGNLARLMGPVGAIAGALILGNVGARWGEDVERSLRGEDLSGDDPSAEISSLTQPHDQGRKLLEDLVPQSAKSSLSSEDRYRALVQDLKAGEDSRASYEVYRSRPTP